MPKSSTASFTAQLLEPTQPVAGPVRVVDEDALGHLDLEHRRIQARRFERRSDVVEHAIVLRWRPLTFTLSSRFSAPGSERRHSATWAHASCNTIRPIGTISPGVLRGLDEIERADEPPIRVLPPQQRLHTGDPPSLQAEDRLVVDDEVAVVQRGLESVDDRVLIEPGSAHRRFVDGDPSPAPGLHRVHRDVGSPQQLVGGSAVRTGHRDADARAAASGRARRARRLLHPPEQPLGDDLRSLDGGVLEQDRELVATEPSGAVVGAAGAQQARTDLAQQVIARGVASVSFTP